MNWKNKLKYILPLIGLCFYVFWNLHYFWEEYIHAFYMILIFMVAVFLFCILIGTLVYQLNAMLTEKLKNKKRILPASIMLVILGLTIYKPMGIIDFQYLEDNLLIAQFVNGLDCKSVIKLRPGNKVQFESYCFGGVSKDPGLYSRSMDSIFMQSAETKDDTAYTSIGLIRSLKASELKFYQNFYANATHSLLVYESLKDTTPIKYVIVKNRLGHGSVK